jgi:hypothetical protein
MDRFAAVYTAGRLCDARASDIGSLAAGTADRRQARAAFAHVATCGHCRPIYAAQLRALRSAAFARKVAALLPVPGADAQQRGRLRGAWDAFADTITRPFTHDPAASATQLAAGGAGRGAGTAIALKLAAALCVAGAGAGACLHTGVLSTPDSNHRKPATRHAQRPVVTATPANDARPVGAAATPAPTPTPRPKRARRQHQGASQGGTGPTSHEQTPASPAPAAAAPNGASEFDPSYQPSQPAQPAPAPAAPGSDEFF